MANKKRNKVIARSIVAAGTLLVGLGIWSSVTNYPQLAQSAITAPGTVVSAPINNSNFSSNDNFLTQPSKQAGPVTGTQSVPIQPAQTPRLRTRGS